MRGPQYLTILHAEEESQNSILDDSTQNPSNHSNSSNVEVLVEGGHSPHHPEPSVQVKNKGKGKGKRKRGNMDEYQRQILELESRKIEFRENKSKQKTDESEDENLLFFKSLPTHIK
ncbi:hypothetical protein RRG08_018927 [Elysia crispata]|uniref:Uncharacterized protein n=1 Tax=Elysia crispata TaxID=231223 RepID=A0AAE0YHG7_9GAST|nr:hypothetical protein RRG08_018927 [Elysia crispata]